MDVALTMVAFQLKLVVSNVSRDKGLLLTFVPHLTKETSQRQHNIVDMDKGLKSSVKYNCVVHLVAI